MKKTKYGKAMLATSEDYGAAKLVGINVDHTIPVSYTHLDVYKRQPLSCNKCGTSMELIYLYHYKYGFFLPCLLYTSGGVI